MKAAYVNTNKRLLESIAVGDEAAFAQLFNAWHGKLKRFGDRFIKSSTLTEDVIQNIFVKIWLHRRQLMKVDNLEAYIYTIARNELYNAMKKELREKINLQKWELNHLYPASCETMMDPDEPTAAILVENAIQHLPARQQEVYMLNKFEKLTRQQIAGQLHLSSETVKKHLQLATRSIKCYLQTNFAGRIFLLLLAISATGRFY